MMMMPDEHSRIEVRPTRRDMRIAIIFGESDQVVVIAEN